MHTNHPSFQATRDTSPTGAPVNQPDKTEHNPTLRAPAENEQSALPPHRATLCYNLLQQFNSIPPPHYAPPQILSIPHHRPITKRYMARLSLTARRPSAARLKSPARARPARVDALPLPCGYLAKSQLPLTALLFVLPLLILHEVGVRWFATLSPRAVEYRITAFTLLNRFFHSFGASGRYLPAMAVVAVLLSWHIARRDRWVFNIPLLPLMVLESFAWAIPLLGVHFLFSRQAPFFPLVGEWKLMASLYLGAGVYEEMVFRLAAFSILSFLLADLAKIPPKVATPLIVVIGASLFSGYHMLGASAIPWQSFIFIGLRGVYYGIIFIERGFGLSAGVHTAYDLILLGLSEAGGH
jgi:hypothetical protein